MKFIYIIILMINIQNLYSQSYIGLNIGLNVDNIKGKEDPYYYEVIGKSYSLQYGARFEHHFRKQFILSIATDFGKSHFKTFDRGINPTINKNLKSFRSSVTGKYFLFDRLYIGIGLSNMVSSVQTVRLSDQFNNIHPDFSKFFLNQISPIYIIGFRSKNFITEAYHINGSIYSEKYNSADESLRSKAIKSIGCTISYLFKLPQREKKKEVDCPKF